MNTVMENVRIAVLNTHDKVCAFLDNKIPDALHYYNDELHSFREGSANTYTFTASATHEDSQYLAEGNKLAFQYNDKDYYFNIVKVTRDEHTVEVMAYSMVFELLNEELEAYKPTKAMKFDEYLNVFDFENVVELRIYEVADKAILHEWTGTSTILARLFSLANVFNAEVEFMPVLNSDYSLRTLVMNVYKEHDEERQGIGRKRTDIVLRYGENVKGVTKTSDITSLFTAIRPYGKDNLTIGSLDKRELDADGNVEYESPKGNINIYAVQARDRFPSNLMANEKERYIAKIWNYETDNVNVLYAQALAELKKLCVPKVSYEVKGNFDTDIGDTVMITDEEFIPPLYLEARVTEQVQSFTNPERDQTTFDNFRELKAEVDVSLLDKMNELIKENKVYSCTITTDNGIVFKNGEGITSLTANVRDAGADVTDQFNILWKKDNVDLAVGRNVVVHAGDIGKKAVYRFEALDGTIVRGAYEVTVSNVSDGADGKDGRDGAPGRDGTPGKDGADGVPGKGIKSIVEYYLASSEISGVTANTDGWTETPQSTTTSRKYLWNYKVITYTDNTTYVSTPVIIGTHGATGPAGNKGADGQMFYATSGTAAATAAKTATLVSGTFSLKTGVTVAVRFTYANTAASPTLNINGTGEKAVYTQGVRYAYWSAGATVIFTYDGSYWRVASEPVYASTATVGNPSGFNVYIDGSSMKIRKGSTVLASYTDAEIKLGVNSYNSVIDLCGGAGRIEAIGTNSLSGLLIRGAKIRINQKASGESGAAISPGLEVDTNIGNVNINGKLYYNNTLLEDMAKWKLLRDVANTSFGSATVPSNLKGYTEFLLTVGPFAAGNTAQNNRVLASAVITVDALRNTKGKTDSNGMHQAYYNSTYWAGLNYVNDTTLQIRASAAGAIARLWAR